MSLQPGSRPPTPFTLSLAERRLPSPIVIPDSASPSPQDESSSLYLPGSLSASSLSPSPSSSPSFFSSLSSLPAGGKRLSLSSCGYSQLMVPPSRPPTPLAVSKRQSLPPAFKLSSLASLAETVTARDEDDDDDDGRGGGGGGGSSGSVFLWPAAARAGEVRAAFSLKSAVREERRRSLATAGARMMAGSRPA